MPGIKRTRKRPLRTCYTTISMNKLRRREYLEKYGSGSKQYRRCTYRITKARIRIKQYHKIRGKIKKIDKLLGDFFEVKPSKLARKGFNDKKSMIIKDLFYKYCIENGVPGADVARYCGIMNLQLPNKRRMKLIRSLNKNEMKQDYLKRFREYLKYLEKEEGITI